MREAAVPSLNSSPCHFAYFHRYHCTHFLQRKRRFLDSFFDDFDRIEQALRPLKQALLQQDSSGKLEKVVNDDSKLSISLDVKKFKPEELSVNLDGRTLKIEGKQETKERNGYTMRTFVRQWKLPKEVDVEQLKSTLSEDGHLAVEAPKVSRKLLTLRSIKIQNSAPPAKENGDVNNNNSSGLGTDNQ